MMSFVSAQEDKTSIINEINFIHQQMNVARQRWFMG